MDLLSLLKKLKYLKYLKRVQLNPLELCRTIFDPKTKKSTYWNPESRLSRRLFCCPTETVCEYEVQYHRRLEQERAQWNQYRESVERELAELRRRLTEGQEEQNLEDEMKKVAPLIVSLKCNRSIFTVVLC